MEQSPERSCCGRRVRCRGLERCERAQTAAEPVRPREGRSKWVPAASRGFLRLGLNRTLIRANLAGVLRARPALPTSLSKFAEFCSLFAERTDRLAHGSSDAGHWQSCSRSRATRRDPSARRQEDGGASGRGTAPPASARAPTHPSGPWPNPLSAPPPSGPANARSRPCGRMAPPSSRRNNRVRCLLRDSPRHTTAATRRRV